jgi:tetratricopeptide (TPR) repeat protein
MSGDLSADDYGKQYNFGDAANTLTLAAKVTTSSDEARKWFSYGLAWNFGYNHEEAMGCFGKAFAADETFAMAKWGLAYCMSSTYNWGPGLSCGQDTIQEAVKVAETQEGITELEKDLITALATRWTEAARDAADPTKLSFGNTPENNIAFGEAMKGVYEKYPDDVDVAATYVEGLMNIKPWALWNRERQGDGTYNITPADDNTLIVIEVLEKFLAGSGVKHPAICHLYCHACELGPNPEKALPAADTLRALVPSCGHLVHMPSHIDAWVGGWEAGTKCNQDGAKADDDYVAKSGNESQFYKFYRMHNKHFVVWCSMFEGNYENAMKYAKQMNDQLDAPGAEGGVTFMLAGIIPMGAVFLEAFSTMHWHTMIRFGKWDDIIAEPQKENKDAYPYNRATGYYAKGVAYASKGDVENAEKQKELFKQEIADGESASVPLSARMMHNNPCTAVLAVAEQMLEGEIEYRKAALEKGGDFDKAFGFLEEAVKLSENLKYDEPWGWMQPARHALGALQMEQGRLEDAEKVYRADIALWKDNMWGLFGLSECLKKQGKKDEAKEFEKKYKAAMKRSDQKLTATCFCAGMAGAPEGGAKAAEGGSDAEAGSAPVKSTGCGCHLA